MNSIPNAMVKDGDESHGRIRKSPSQIFPRLGALKRMKVVTYNINRNHCITKPNTAGRKEQKNTLKIGSKHFLGGG